MKNLRNLFGLRDICFKLLNSIKVRENAYKELIAIIQEIKDEKEIVKRNELN